MSMLTPPGMGGKKFRVTGRRYPRMRRRRHRGRTVLALVASVTVLGLLGYGTVQLVDVFSSGGEGGGAPRTQAGARAANERDCTAPARDGQQEPPRLPAPRSITVNVYNATQRTGLAQETADALEERGFTIGDVDNAPEDLDGRVEAPGLLLGSPAAREAGALSVLGAQLEGAQTRERGNGEDPGPEVVDLVIGEDFSGLAAAREAERRLAALAGADASPGTC